MTLGHPQTGSLTNQISGSSVGDATQTGSPSTQQTGKLDSYSISGFSTSNYYTIPHQQDWSNTDWTIAYWGKASSTSGYQMGISNRDSGSTGGNGYISLGQSGSNFEFNYGAGWASNQSGNSGLSTDTKSYFSQLESKVFSILMLSRI